MSAVGLESIDHTVQLTHTWINDLDAGRLWLKVTQLLFASLDFSCSGVGVAHPRRGVANRVAKEKPRTFRGSIILSRYVTRRP